MVRVIKKSGTTLASLAFFLLSILFFGVGVAHAITVSESVTLQLKSDSGGSYDVTMSSGSTFTSLTINSAGTLNIQVGADESVTLTNSADRSFSNDQGVTPNCGSIILGANKTYNVNIGGTCSVSGGGGGSVSNPMPTPTPTPTPDAASTPAPSSSDVGSTPTSPTTTSSLEPTPVSTSVTPTPTPSAPTAQLAIPTKELARGLKNDEDVMKLQILLAADPDTYPEGLVTGNFGPATFAAVKRFQEKYGLPAVGRVGPMTLAKLAEVFGGGATQQQAEQQSAAPSSGKLTRELQMGDEGDDVSQLQAYLAGDPEIYPEGKITGYFGALTRAAVKRFQAKYGIAQVGRVGPMTLAKLNELMQ